MNQNIDIEKTPDRGKTIIAKRDFSAGERVFIVTGPITKTSSKFTVPIAADLFIDPLLGCGRELNHSCNPNCGIKNRNCITAMQDIKKGEEITIDYAMIVDDYGTTEEGMITCACGSNQCRGKLGSYKQLSQEKKKEYEGFISDFLTSSSPQKTRGLFHTDQVRDNQ